MPRSRFVSAIKKYSIESEPVVFPIRFGPKELNNTIKSLLRDNEIDASNVNFNFFINGELLNVPLGEFIEARQISEEIEEIVYDIDMEPPKLDGETKTEEFITGMKFRSKYLAVASVDLQIFDITALEKPVVFIITDHPQYTVDWVSLNEETHEAYLISGGDWNTMIMWKCDLQSGTANQIFDYKGHLSNITKVIVSPDGKLVASGSEDGQLKIWSASTSASDLSEETGGIPHVSKNKAKVPIRIPIVTMLAHNRDVRDIKWIQSPLKVPGDQSQSADSNRQLLTCSNDFYLKLWHINGLETQVLREVKAPYEIFCIDYSEVHKLVLATTGDGRLRVYDLRAETAEIHNIYRPHEGWISCLQWSGGNNNLFVSTSRKGETKLWDIRNMKLPLMVLSNFNWNSITSCQWRKDGQYLANAYRDGALRLYKFDL